MSKKELFINWLRRFGLIHGFTMMMFYIVFQLFQPDLLLNVRLLGNMILFSLAGTLPGMIYYTTRDITEKEWWIRTVIHFFLLNILLLPIAHAIGLWQDFSGLLVIIGVILLIDVLVHILSFSMDWVAARDINRILQKNHSTHP